MFSSVYTVTDSTTPEYYDIYKSSIHKLIKKRLDIKSFDIEYLKSLDKNNSFLEKYLIKDLKSDKRFYLYCGPVVTCDLGGCTASKFVKSNTNSKEYFDILIIHDEAKVIKQIKVLNYLSDFGYEVTSKAYLKKFNNHNVCNFSFENSAVDAISGATISSDAIISSIESICDELKE